MGPRLKGKCISGISIRGEQESEHTRIIGNLKIYSFNKPGAQQDVEEPHIATKKPTEVCDPAGDQHEVEVPGNNRQNTDFLSFCAKFISFNYHVSSLFCSIDTKPKPGQCLESALSTEEALLCMPLFSCCYGLISLADSSEMREKKNNVSALWRQ